MLTLLQAEQAASESIMLQNGKIFLVMAVVCIVLIGLFLYVTSIDKKIKQLEKNNAHLRRNIKMYEIKVGNLRRELSKAINDADAASRGYNINNDRL